eukprot:1575076-Karenia_brevis.AAC.1
MRRALTITSAAWAGIHHGSMQARPTQPHNGHLQIVCPQRSGHMISQPRSAKTTLRRMPIWSLLPRQ